MRRFFCNLKSCAACVLRFAKDVCALDSDSPLHTALRFLCFRNPSIPQHVSIFCFLAVSPLSPRLFLTDYPDSILDLVSLHETRSTTRTVSKFADKLPSLSQPNVY